MQTCSKCKVEKSLDQFPRRPDRPSGRGTICLACGREYRRAHYLANIAYYLEKGRRGRQALRRRNFEHLVEYLRSHPCVDCGESDIRVLQFDHLNPTAKTDEVSNLVRRAGSWLLVAHEIEKCEVRCGNCHRRKTLRELRSRPSVRRMEEQRGPWLPRNWAIMDAWAVSSVDRAAVF